MPTCSTWRIGPSASPSIASISARIRACSARAWATISGLPSPRSSVWVTARSSVTLTFSPANSASRFAASPCALASFSNAVTVSAVRWVLEKSKCRPATSIEKRDSRSGSASNSASRRSCGKASIALQSAAMVSSPLSGRGHREAEAAAPAPRRPLSAQSRRADALDAAAGVAQPPPHGRYRNPFRTRLHRDRRHPHQAEVGDPGDPGLPAQARPRGGDLPQFLLLALLHPLAVDAAAALCRRLSVHLEVELRLFALVAPVRRAADPGQDLRQQPGTRRRGGVPRAAGRRACR